MVAVDNVYRTVLNILNKESRGYITPSEFNTLAKQAQTEIFESYFTTQYRVDQGPMSDSDYSDIRRNIEEKISIFERTSDAIPVNSGVYPYPSNFYRLGVVFTDTARVHITEVTHKDMLYIDLAPLTKPTASQPIYTRHEGGIQVLPIGVGDIRMTFIRTPLAPEWVGTTFNGQLIEGNSAPFELHPSEEPELVAKILAYSGVIVRAADVVQAAAAKEQQIATDNG